MIRKQEIQELTPKPAKKGGDRVTAQVLRKILVLNCYQDHVLIGRWCMDTETGRYLTWTVDPLAWTTDTGGWAEKKLMTVFGRTPSDWGNYHWYEGWADFDTKKDQETVREMIGKGLEWQDHGFRIVEDREQQYNRDRRERKEENRIARTNALMSRVPPLPADFQEWVHRAAGGRDYLFPQKGETGRRFCTACGETFAVRELDKKKEDLREGLLLECPRCKRKVIYAGRKRTEEWKGQCLIFQDMGEGERVARYIDVFIGWDQEGRHTRLSEAIRAIISGRWKKNSQRFYYAQDFKTEWKTTHKFDQANRANRGTEKGFLYPQGIGEALTGTRYEPWIRAFKEAAERNLPMDYSIAMCHTMDPAFVSMCEYLLKGRFYRLAAETVRSIAVTENYTGPLEKHGAVIEEVFRIRDRQKINRIRDMDGGKAILEWMQHADASGRKLTGEFLEWAQERDIRPRDLPEEDETGLSPVQAMNYIRRQKRESYPGQTDWAVANQWNDYLEMCRKTGKNLKDPMVSRPRELKRRHDEAVEERARLWELEKARRDREWKERIEREMREKYPGAEENLDEIREKYEYEDETYRIIVPGKLSEIAEEGRALHHCAGSSERYYERIMRHETYICFLRKKEEPEKPYYTIEVEPGGTIRQHRSEYDEEPGIEEIRGFLRKWQKVIRARMKAEDRRRAERSRQLREDNLRELREKNNTRVLAGLMEDFMDAEVPEAAMGAI